MYMWKWTDVGKNCYCCQCSSSAGESTNHEWSFKLSPYIHTHTFIDTNVGLDNMLRVRIRCMILVAHLKLERAHLYMQCKCPATMDVCVACEPDWGWGRSCSHTAGWHSAHSRWRKLLLWCEWSGKPQRRSGQPAVLHLLVSLVWPSQLHLEDEKLWPIEWSIGLDHWPVAQLCYFHA